MADVVFDSKLALEQFEKRKAANKDKVQINDSDLPAGSPMHFYCRFCCVFTGTLPESYTCDPPTVCHPCQVLHDHGLI